MAYLTTDDLRELVVAALPTANQESSALLKAGVVNVNYNTDILRRAVMPGPAYTDETGIKRVANPVLSETEVKYIKLVNPIIVSDEFEDTDEGRRLAANLVGQAVAGFPAGVDISLFSGTDPRTGNKVANLADFNLSDNATIVTSADPTTIDVTIENAGLALDELDHVLLSRKGFSQVAQLRTTASGLRKYPEVTRRGTYDFAGVDADTFRSVGLNGWTPSPIYNNNLAILGDFSKIGMAWLPPEVRILTEATIGGVNLGETNQKAYVIEQKVKAYIDDAGSFAVVKQAAGN